MLRWVSALLVLLSPFGARAAPVPFELRWSAPRACPTEQEVSARITSLLEAAPESSTRGLEVQALARVRATAGGFEVALELKQGETTRSRTLAAPACEEVARAAALLVALAVEPALAELGPSPAPPQGASASCFPAEALPPAPVPLCPASPACPPTPEAPAPRREPTEPLRLGLVAGVSASYGALPRVSPRPLLGAGYAIGRHWLEVSLGAAFSSSRGLEGARVATFAHWFGAPRYCLGFPSARVLLAGCAVLEVGMIRASGFGVDEPLTQREWWLAGGAGLQLGKQLSHRAQLLLGLDLLVPVTRPAFELANEPVHTPKRVLPTLRLTLVGG